MSGNFVASNGHAELDQLQGVWEAVASPHRARLLIAGTHFAFELDENQLYMGRFDLDVEASPKVIDMHIHEGPDEHRGQTARCIFDLNGKSLRWCPAKIGTDERMESFPQAGDNSHLSLTFERSYGARSQPTSKARPSEIDILLCDLDD